MRLPIYLDHNATTPVDPAVLDAMLPYYRQKFGNAASKTHAFGWEADDAVETARQSVATVIGGRAADIVFTSGATESNNLAILGAAEAHQSRGRHIVTSTVEHKATLDPIKALEKRGFEVTWLSPDEHGAIDPASVEAALRPDTILVSLMLANNELGTLNPIADVGALTRDRGVLLHTDAAQAVGKIPVDVNALNVDLLSLSGHKLYAPKGVGVLYVRGRAPRARLAPVIFGGGHEHGLRSGTLNVPAIVGLGHACELVTTGDPARATVAALDARLRELLSEQVSDVVFRGHPTARIPGLISATFPGVESEALMLGLPEIAISSGSACTSAQLDPSHVLRGIGLSKGDANCTVRFGIGRFNTADEIAFTAQRVAQVVARLRG